MALAAAAGAVRSEQAFAQQVPWSCGAVEDGVENGLHVVRRTRNGAQHFRDGRLLLDQFGYPILRLRSGPFCVDTLVHAEQFLGLAGEGSITAPAAVRDRR